MLNPSAPICAKIIKSEAVLFGVYFLDQTIFQFCPLGWFHEALKDGVLHPLAIILAGFGDPPQPPGAACILHGYIVTDKNEHQNSPLFPKEDRDKIGHFQINGG